MTTIKFHLQFQASEINKYADAYVFNDDANAMAAGEKIRDGQFTRENLREIFEWKTGGRGRSRLAQNNNQEIADALHSATDAKTDRVAIAVLLGLRGVHIPVASAILTAIFPERFTIIDFRALEALGIRKSSITLEFYLQYLNECRQLAHQNTVSLRTLDRALWQWSKEKSRP